MMTGGTDVGKFMDGLGEGKYWSPEDEGSWEEILDDEEAEIKPGNLRCPL